jgi:hypothetical protein
VNVAPLGERLTFQECLSLLGGSGAGRLGVSVDSLPVVVPVRYTLDEDTLTFLAAVDFDLTATIACMAVDQVDELGWGWNVLVVGRTSVDAGDTVRSTENEHARIVRMSLELISGSRVGPVARRPFGRVAS